MGDLNQYLWVKKNVRLIRGPILEIGSKFYDPRTSMNYRGLVPGLKYIGADMDAGPNVDHIIDFTSDFDSIANQVGANFNTIICCSVMEHVKDIYSFANNVSRILSPGGILFISVPFTWEFHGYPDDYWRFTPSAIRFLYPELDFTKHEMTVSSSVDGDVMTMSDELNLNSFIMKENVYSKFESTNKGAFRFLKKMINLASQPEYRKEFIIRKMLKKEYRLSLSCINMIGVKK